jgi:hypothetical protein
MSVESEFTFGRSHSPLAEPCPPSDLLAAPPCLPTRPHRARTSKRGYRLRYRSLFSTTKNSQMAQLDRVSLSETRFLWDINANTHDRDSRLLLTVTALRLLSQRLA